VVDIPTRAVWFWRVGFNVSSSHAAGCGRTRAAMENQSSPSRGEGAVTLARNTFNDYSCGGRVNPANLVLVVRRLLQELHVIVPSAQSICSTINGSLAASGTADRDLDLKDFFELVIVEPLAALLPEAFIDAVASRDGSEPRALSGDAKFEAYCAAHNSLSSDGDEDEASPAGIPEPASIFTAGVPEAEPHQLGSQQPAPVSVEGSMAEVTFAPPGTPNLSRLRSAPMRPKLDHRLERMMHTHATLASYPPTSSRHEHDTESFHQR